MHHRTAVIVMIKYPWPGSVKTRLGRQTGMEKEAAQKTGTCDVVIGPALDGGYYLAAMTRDRFCPGMFDDIPWSTADVLDMTLERLAAWQREFCLLKPLRDIDNLADLQAVSAETGLIFEVSDK